MDAPCLAGGTAGPFAQDRALLAASGQFDEAFYRKRARLHPSEDAIEHYLDLGWRAGLEPRAGFDGAFLSPFYEASGLTGAPLPNWIGLGGFGPRVVQTEAEARHLAAIITASPAFDPGYYARQIGEGVDPALHYVIAGESLGLRPSEGFDAGYYMECNPDVAVLGLSPLRHFEQLGRAEGRRVRSAVDRVATPGFEPGGRPTILVLAHEASRTGAPILSWQLARDLSARYDVVSVLLNGGELVGDFAAVSRAVVGPLSHAEWNMPDMRRLADRVVDAYRPLFAIANSIETHWLVPPLAKHGVPSVGLMHEFAAYTRPLSKMSNVFDWATDIVFPAQIVAQSAFEYFPHLRERQGIHVRAQGRVDPPRRAGAVADGDPPWTPDERFTVLAAGSVQIRKGTDLFLSIADQVRRMAPEIAFHFVWIGEGYDPLGDPIYSAYLGEQLARSALQDVVDFIRPVEDLEPAYAAADVFLMCSRLDPQPNVGIDAVVRGLPVVCFEGGCGTAEILAQHGMTRELVAPHLDVHAAATIIVGLARDGGRRARMRTAVAGVGRQFYDMEGYVAGVDALGRAAAARLVPEDRDTIEAAGVLDVDLMLQPGEGLQGADGLVFTAMQQWAATGTSENQAANARFRRPCAGFHPQVYAAAHRHALGGADGATNPLAHWLRAGKPAGPWSHAVFGPLDGPVATSLRVLMHGHFRNPEVAYDLQQRLGVNATVCDLVLTTDTVEKATMLERAARDHAGVVTVRVMPDRGRNLGPLLEVLRGPEVAGYDVVGHVHGEHGLSMSRATTKGDLGDLRRGFLFENLVGGIGAPMLDTVAHVFAMRADVGLVWAEDPHLTGWEANRPAAERLALRLGVRTALPTFFDFPNGAMFYARPAALEALMTHGLGWQDMPEEPMAGDGTVLDAFERLLPFIVAEAGGAAATVRVPGTSW